MSRQDQEGSEQGTRESQEPVQAGWRRPLPERYHRTFEETPFDACDFCHKPLLVPGARYAIIKLYSEDELRQELAICTDCGGTLRDGYSAESQQAIEAVFGRVPFARRLRQALDESLDPFEQMTRRCLLCHTPRGQARSHVEYADCEAGEMVYAIYPFAVCETCQVSVYDALSDQTKEIERRFFDEHFGFPPPGSPALERQPELPAWIVL
jgi:hypothetical protein